MVSRISEALTLPEEKIDILFFDLQEADPDILYEAVNNGVLLKNESPELLGESIEKLSLYLIQNEFIITRAKQLRHEQLEVFCADWYRQSGDGCEVEIEFLTDKKGSKEDVVIEVQKGWHADLTRIVYLWDLTDQEPLESANIRIIEDITESYR